MGPAFGIFFLKGLQTLWQEEMVSPTLESEPPCDCFIQWSMAESVLCDSWGYLIKGLAASVWCSWDSCSSFWDTTSRNPAAMFWEAHVTSGAACRCSSHVSAEPSFYVVLGQVPDMWVRKHLVDFNSKLLKSCLPEASGIGKNTCPCCACWNSLLRVHVHNKMAAVWCPCLGLILLWNSRHPGHYTAELLWKRTHWHNIYNYLTHNCIEFILVSRSLRDIYADVSNCNRISGSDTHEHFWAHLMCPVLF